MTIMTLLLALSLDLRQSDSPQVRCGITTVGYRFVGSPGKSFEYGGDAYTVPRSGWIELIADGSETFRAIGRTIALDVWPADQFSFREVRLPKEIATDP